MSAGPFTRLLAGAFLTSAALGVFLGAALGAPASAQNDDDQTIQEGEQDGAEPPLDTASALVELPGDCENDIGVFDPGVSVDCIFRLLPDVEADDVDFASVSDGDELFVPCRVSGRVVRCQDVGGDFVSGERALRLVIDDELHENAASFTSVWSDTDELYVSLPTEEPVSFDGLPIEVFSYPSAPIGGLYLNIRVRGSTRIVDSVEIDAGTPTASGQSRLEFDLPAGRYRMWPCVGATPTTCEELSGGNAFQVVDPVVNELIEGHNRRSGERINILFVGSGLGGDRDRIADIATEMLGLDGPVPVDLDGTRAFEPADIVDVRFGPMAIEPLASNAHKFNFWYLEADLGSELSLVFDASVADVLDVFDLPNLHVTAIYANDANGVSDARGTSFYGRRTVPPTDQIRFGGTRVFVSPEAPLYAAQTLAHEWGHALFELRDEYYGFDGRPVSLAFPNCAPDESIADDWWASHLGDVDPFAAEVVAIRDGFGLQPDPYFAPLADLVRIEPSLGGCYGNAGEATAFRPSRDSLMNSEIPVFGSVNRARVETVLSRFSGSGPLSTLEDLTIACEAVGLEFECTGTLPTYVEPPDGAFLVGGEPCAFELDPVAIAVSDDGLDRHLVRCEGTLPSSSSSSSAAEPEAPEASDVPEAPETISIQLDTVVDTIELRQLPPPPPEPAEAEQPEVTTPTSDDAVAAPSTTDAETAANDVAEDGVLAGGDGGRSGLIALAVGFGVLLAGLVVSRVLSIRQARDAERSP